MADILILGGTRNLGHVTAVELFNRGHNVSILNRGQTRDELPPRIERLRANRAKTLQVRDAVRGRSFDLVLDATTYTGAEAAQAVEIFRGRVGRYVFISSGQVYLVREGLDRPFRETDYAGPVMPAPPAASADYSSWKYGADKRDAEEVFMAARADSDFPLTTLRLPMVASERDHYGRIQGYAARIMDGGPLLIPEGTGLPLRHVYVADVANLVTGLAESKAGIGSDYNISYGESMTLDRFIELLSSALGATPEIVRADRPALEARGLLPDCSPFSGRWMSELDNAKSLADLRLAGIVYTSPQKYLPRLVKDYRTRWKASGITPEGYAQRPDEISFAKKQ